MSTGAPSGPGGAGDPLAAARALHAGGDLAGAERECRARLARRPRDAAALRMLGYLSLQVGRPAQAADLLREAIAIEPRDPQSHFNLGFALLGAEQPEAAVDSYAEAVRQAPRWPEACNSLGLALQACGRADEAIEAFERATRLAPGSADAPANLGLLLAAQGRRAEALKWLAEAARREPQAADLHRYLGEALAAAGRWPEAAQQLARAGELAPGDAVTHFHHGCALDEMGLAQAAAEAYRRAIEADQDHTGSHVNLGLLLREAGRLDDAAECFRRALAAAPGDRDAERHLRAVLARQLPAWHFPMLADARRNDAYRRALDNAITPDSVVLDIGTGSGLLAMMAARAGARRVYACEMSAPLAETARAVVAANGLQARIEILNCKSTSLRLGETLPEAATVVVSEIVDVGLLGEGVLPSVRHAVAALAAPGAVVIPAAAILYGRLVRLPELRPMHPVRDISGFDLGAFDRFRDPEAYLDLQLARTPHQRFSDDFEIARFDLADPPAPIPASAPRRRALRVPATASGAVHAVALWFELALDRSVSLSTAPESPITAWGQAVQFFDEDLPARAGEVLRLEAAIDDLRVRVAPPP